MSSENALWQTMRKAVAPYGFFHRVENSAALGTSDVYFALPRRGAAAHATSGWIELKHVHEFPARATTPIVINHLTIDQVRFLEAVAANGAVALGLLQIRRSYFILGLPLIRGIYERQVDAGRLAAEALNRPPFGPAFPTRKLIRCLTAL